MHLHIKHVGQGDRPHNVAVDYLVLILNANKSTDGSNEK